MLKDTLIVIKAIVTSITNTEAKNNSAYTYVFWQASGVYGLPPLNLRLQIVRIVMLKRVMPFEEKRSHFFVLAL